MGGNHLLIFVKYPLTGQVKTRLGNRIGFHKSRDIYHFLLKMTFDRFLDSELYRSWVFYTPSGYYRNIKRMINKHSVNLEPQEGSDLGERLANAFRHVFDSGAKNAVVIGSDCFDLTIHEIEDSFKILNSGKNRAVIGPSLDGGYYLLGMREYKKAIFKGIDWGTDHVLRQTQNRIVEEGKTFHLLDPLRDIDKVEDISIEVLNCIRDYNAEFRIT